MIAWPVLYLVLLAPIVLPLILLGHLSDRLRWRVEALEERADRHLEAIATQSNHLGVLSRGLSNVEVRPLPELAGVDRDPPPRWRP